MPSPVAISPDARYIAFAAEGERSTRRIFVRRMNELNAVPIDGAQGEIGSVWISPDGEWVAYNDSADAALKKVAANGGPPITITSLGAGSFGGVAVAWAPNGSMMFSSPSLHGSAPRVTAGGHLLFVRAGAIWAAPFDAARLELSGRAIPVLEDVAGEPTALAFQVAGEGTMVYVSGSPAEGRERPVWVGLDGREIALDVPPGTYYNPAISPDGHQAAFRVRSGDNSAIWTYSLRRDTMTRLTAYGHYLHPTWSPDGQWIFYSAKHGGSLDLYQLRADGSGEERRLTAHPRDLHVYSVSGDGAQLLYSECDQEVLNCDLGRLVLDEDRTETLLSEQAMELWPAISPNGRWVAYGSTSPASFRSTSVHTPTCTRGAG